MATQFIYGHTLTTILLLILLPATTTAQVQDIFDTDANPVQVGKLYYILPVVKRQGGGIATAPKNTTQSCLLYVAQETNTASLGHPVKFYRAMPTTSNVTFSSDMNVVFGNNNNCDQSPVWKLIFDEPTGRKYVTLGGLQMARGPTYVDNWFRIERFFPRFHYDYKLVFCPDRTICPTCQNTCGDLGVFVQEDGTWLLGVGAPPLRIKFKKA